MRFLHLADLHLGKIIYKRSMLEDQRFVLEQIIKIAGEQHLDGVLIAGDLYQRNSPAPEAMSMLSWFLTELHALGLPVYIISGNHDSAERLAYLSEIAALSDIHIASPVPGEIRTVSVQDAFGPLHIHLLSFCTPMQIRQRFPDRAEEIVTYTDMTKLLLSLHPVDKNARNVILAHQFLVGAETCESEELSVGGTDSIPAALFDDYDYVALGHLHGPQSVGRETVRYAGSPLKYSFSEVSHKKSVTVVELREKGNVQIETIPLEARYEMREDTGDFDTLMNRPADGTEQDYLHLTLIDEDPPVDAAKRLRGKYKNLMQVTIRNSKFREDRIVTGAEQPESLSFETMMRKFYAERNNGAAPSEAQMAIVKALMEELDEEVDSE